MQVEHDVVVVTAEADVSLRVLVITAVGAGLGTFAWRFPAVVNPMLIVVAAYTVLDRLTEERNVR